jgi:molybdate transport system ATP-binding protein
MITIDNVIAANSAIRFSKPLTLRIEDGEQVAIVGANGSGKTTVAQLLLGRYPLASGSIHYDFEPEPVYKNVKFIAFRDSYGSADNAYYLQQRWNSQDCDASPLVRDTIHLSGKECVVGSDIVMRLLIPLLDKQLVMLSGGEMRKYQLFRLLLSKPKILIIDNPFIGLDCEARTMLTELLESITNSTQLILLLSRSNEVPTFINRIVDTTNGFIPSNATCGVKSAVCNHSPSIGTSNTQPIIEMRGVSIRYNGKTILDNINWTVKRGEKWALMGRNGSGKSTLLSLICADNPQAYACEVSLFGQRRGSGESIWDIKKRIGYVSPELHRSYNVNISTIEIVADGFFDSIGLYQRPSKEQLECCEQWLYRFGVFHLKHRCFMQLSDGEQRMALLVRAFVKDPELLILDEPFHGLDEYNTFIASSIIEQYAAQEGKTLIMVTHFEHELPSCIDKRFILN